MKSIIMNVQSGYYPNKFVVYITRGDGKHLPKTNIYSVNYSDKRKLTNLAKRFLKLHDLFVMEILLVRIKNDRLRYD